jgi:hypothetical protein
MAHSFLITGGTVQSRLKKAQEIIEKVQVKKIKDFFQNPDIFILEEKDSIKISQIRELKKRLSLTPLASKFKIALLIGAEKLTLPAQNALLKTLEEPPSRSIIILAGPNQEVFLPTIISRCQIIRLSVRGKQKFLPKDNQENLKFCSQIILMSPGERLKLAERLTKTKQEALEFILKQLYLWQKIILKKTTSQKSPPLFKKIGLGQAIKTAKNIQKTHELIEAQINRQLAIENLLISYPYA